MSYKGMNDRRKRSSLLPFLQAADFITGALVTALVDKDFAKGMQLEGSERDALPVAVRSWPVGLIRKFIWVAHIGSLLVAGLSAKRQNLLWFTDQDDIAANDERVIETTPVVMGILSNYLAHDMGHLRFGTTKCDNGDLFIEDFAAIPDLAAGALVEIPKVGPIRQQSRMWMPLRGHVPLKALNILSWLGAKSGALCKISLVVSHGDLPRNVRVRALELETAP